MRILFIGDIVGELGRTTLIENLPKLKQKYRPQVTIANGENAAHGRGITEKIYKQLLQAGVDVITMGNHTWDNKTVLDFIDDAHKLVRPANFPDGTPGKGYVIVNVNHQKLAVVNLQGRVFMPPLDDPFLVGRKIVDMCLQETPHIFVDFHAEATSEKQALGWYLDGDVSVVVGTHTHIQTNDARILPKGTAYLTDVGMTGAYDSVLGFQTAPIIEKFVTQLPNRHEVVADEQARTIISGCFVELDDVSGKAKKIETIRWVSDQLLNY